MSYTQTAMSHTQTDIHTDRQTYRQTDIQTDRQTYRHTGNLEKVELKLDL